MKSVLKDLYQDQVVVAFLFIRVYLAFSTMMYIRIRLWEEQRAMLRYRYPHAVYSIQQLPVETN